MLTKLKTRWRDWRRGYTELDALNAWDKVNDNPQPGKLVLVTQAEFKAITDPKVIKQVKFPTE